MQDKGNNIFRNLKKYDAFGTQMQLHFFDNTRFRTIFGGIVTLIVYPILASIVIYVLFLFDNSSKDIVFTSSDINPFTAPNEGIFLNESINGNVLKFSAYVNDPEFNNDDNPYGKLRLHIYTNMNNLTDTSTKGFVPPFKDFEVPIVPCDNARDVDWANSKRKQYCPQFNETHFLYGGFYSQKFSWMRLTIHNCDHN